ncbi:MAP6 domain-containing protein 1 isoform X4 [Phalacrocorax carbo]|uniref:MAP6 domain-containing protein 1 isoform X4 n=1 Tax=Phalacrocorax carbo TaxID=9209 RepID=UPI003119C83A
MAWPCISRVCCLARFWSQLDKSDLSVPLTIHNYSDIEEQEDGATQRGGPPPRGSARPPAPASRPRDPAAGKAGGRRKGRAVAAGEPFAAETQYRRDFRAWPLPRRDAFPWVSASSGGRDGAAPQPAPGRAVCALPGGGPEQLRPRSPADGGHTTSYRTLNYCHQRARHLQITQQSTGWGDMPTPKSKQVLQKVKLKGSRGTSQG